ncbi:MAG: leucyl aminopeptidase [Blastocatellia bacterium]|jgi:leucyl aminopeptidase|nr:leucyl aminopeptidase [Blastocatellia bacterium]MBK6428697.1 leucyl aminopeptidase [Blastocatellia bacterium]
MDVKADAGRFDQVEADALVVSVFEGEDPTEGVIGEVNQAMEGLIKDLMGSDELRGKSGDMVYLYRPGNVKARRVLLVGVGKREDFDLDSVRQLAGSAVRYLRGKGARTVAILRRSQIDIVAAAEAAVEGALIGLYEPDVYRTSDREERRIETLILCTAGGGSAEDLERGIARGRILGESTNFTRELVNEPSNAMTPEALSLKAQEMASRLGMEIDILDEPRLHELGMGAILGVGRGSDEPSRLVVLRYLPEGAPADRTVAIVGKGVTFDTGGISIKPSDGMEKMKYDMAGAAAVFGAMRAIGLLQPNVNVLGIAPLVENMPSGRALKPGDIVKGLSGRSIEILNTDAEGRLILSDAISYARRLGATEIIDLATLTGAVSVALGHVNAAILGTDDELVARLIGAGNAAGEKLWRLPLDPEFREIVKSDVADLKNSTGRAAGTITAAHFLREFAEDTPWAHLDIAGMAWQNEKKAFMAKGPSGFGVRTLVNYVACNE